MYLSPNPEESVCQFRKMDGRRNNHVFLALRMQVYCMFIKKISCGEVITRSLFAQILTTSLKKRSSSWQLYRHWWHNKLSLWRLTRLPMMRKLANWPCLFSVPEPSNVSEVWVVFCEYKLWFMFALVIAVLYAKLCCHRLRCKDVTLYQK